MPDIESFTDTVVLQLIELPKAQRAEATANLLRCYDALLAERFPQHAAARHPFLMHFHRRLQRRLIELDVTGGGVVGTA